MKRATVALLLLAACGGTPRAAPCTIHSGPGGDRELVCPDGSSAPLPGAGSCMLDASGTTPLLRCDDGRQAPLPSGCTFEARGDGTRLLHCPGEIDVVLPPASSGELHGSVTLLGQTDATTAAVSLEGTAYSTTADASGHYSLGVPTGIYTAVFSAPGFASERREGVVVDVGADALNVLLRRGVLVGPGDGHVIAQGGSSVAVQLGDQMAVLRPGKAPLLLGYAAPDQAAVLCRDGTRLAWNTGVDFLDSGEHLEIGLPVNTNPKFSASGDALSFEARGQVYFAELKSGRQPVPIAVGQTWAYKWIGDAFLANLQDFTLVEVRPGDEAPIPVAHYDDLRAFPFCGPDDLGSGLALCEDTLVHLQTATSERVPFGTAVADSSGQLLAYQTFQPPGMFLRRVATGETTPLESANLWPQGFSPSGWSVAFIGIDGDAGFELWEVAGATRTAKDPGTFVGFTSDSSAAIALEADGSLASVPVDGSAPRTLAAGPFTSQGSPQLQGRYFLIDRAQKLSSLVDRETQAVIDLPGLPGWMTPDESAAVVPVDAVHNDVVELPSGRAVALPDLASIGGFSPSGREVYFTLPIDTGSELVVFSRNSGALRTIDRGVVTPIAALDILYYLRAPGLDEDLSTPPSVFAAPLN